MNINISNGRVKCGDDEYPVSGDINIKQVSNKTIMVNEHSIRITDPVVNVYVNGNCNSIDTASGDIDIKGDAYKVNTVSADITCNNISCSCSTISGDINVKGRIAGNCSTLSGDISSRR